MSKKRVISFIWNLKNREGMYLLDKNYHSLLAMIMGYFQAILDSEQTDFSHDFQDWLGAKNSYRSSIHWGEFILVEISKNDENLAKKKLLEMLSQFLEDDKISQ